MNRKELITVFIILNLISIAAGAQYSKVTGVVEGTDTSLVYTKPYIVCNGGLFTSTYYLSFQKRDTQYYVVSEFVAWNIPDLDMEKLISTTFIFRDGFELVIPATSYYKKVKSDVPEYNGSWTNYPVRGLLTEEQLSIFTKKQLLSVAHNFKDISKKFDVFVPLLKSFYIAGNALFFFTGEDLEYDVLAERFAENEMRLEYNNNLWDY